MNYQPKNYINAFNSIKESKSHIDDLNFDPSEFIRSEEELDFRLLEKHISVNVKELDNNTESLHAELIGLVQQDFDDAQNLYMFLVDKKIEENEFPFKDWMETISEINIERNTPLVNKDFLDFLKKQPIQSELFLTNSASLFSYTNSYVKYNNPKILFEWLEDVAKINNFLPEEILFASKFNDFYINLNKLKAENSPNGNPLWFFEYFKFNINNNNKETLDRMLSLIEKYEIKDKLIDTLINEYSNNLFIKYTYTSVTLVNSKPRFMGYKTQQISDFFDLVLAGDIEKTEYFVDKIIKKGTSGLGLPQNNKEVAEQTSFIRGLVNKSFACKLDKEMSNNSTNTKKHKI